MQKSKLLNNNKGQVGVMVMVVLVVLIIGVGVYFVSQNFGDGDDANSPQSCADSTSVLTISPRSALATGTAPSSPTVTCGMNGGAVTTSVTSGTTTFPVGSDLECLVSKADYIDQVFEFEAECGGTNLDASLYSSSSDNPSLTWYNDDDNAMTDNVAGGATNQTDLSVGETFTLKLKIQGTAGESSGNGILVVEFPASTSSNITSVTLDGKSSIGIPSVHSLQNAGSKAVAFEVDAVEGGKVAELYMNVQLGATKDLTGGVLTDWYSEQDFIDDDSTTGTGIEDSDGTATYENTLDSDFLVN